MNILMYIHTYYIRDEGDVFWTMMPLLNYQIIIRRFNNKNYGSCWI